MADSSDSQLASAGKNGEALTSLADDTVCDLVMKGGITSGVIYPKLVSQLALRYRFKNIGGTSAGAIAAGACAAAEFGRHHKKPDAFEELAKLPGILGTVMPQTGRSKLFSLFQPTDSLRQHFGILAGVLDAKPVDGARRVVLGMLKMHLLLVCVCLLVGSLFLWPFVEALTPALHWVVTGIAAIVVLVLIACLLAFIATVAAKKGVLYGIVCFIGVIATLAWLLPILFGVGWSLSAVWVVIAMTVVATLDLALVLVLVAVRFAGSLLQGLHGNGYGICSGRTSDASPKGTLGLTDWLARYFDQLAGPRDTNGPLTFGDLWGTTAVDAPREINLEVMTTAVSQQMVYSIPFREGLPSLHYDPEEWSKLFPPEVMKWLKKAAEPKSDGDGSKPTPAAEQVISASGKPLHALPHHADLPVVVAVRMSLSFPILLSAVPLYSVDWSLTDNQDKQAAVRKAAKNGVLREEKFVATRIWFSDGGIGSNMPLHMFDALLPDHPTFAVNLKAQHPDHDIQQPERPDNDGGRIYLPETNQGGRVRYWPEPADGRPLVGLVGFLSGIVNTMQNWRDEILFPYPGFRDRIVQISQRPTEGGLNLDMPKEQINTLAHAGEMAAERLIDRFHPQGEEKGAGWTNHKRVRLGTFLGTMQPGSTLLVPSITKGVWAECIPHITGYGPAERQLAYDFLDQLVILGRLGPSAGTTLAKGALKPVAQIGIAPKI